jgi:hypothetical protein
MVDKVALGQVFPRLLGFSPLSLIPPVLHYTEKPKHLHHRFAKQAAVRPKRLLRGPSPRKKKAVYNLYASTKVQFDHKLQVTFLY